MVLREIISLFQPMESILLALAGVSSRPAGNVSVDQHPTYRFSNGCLFSSFLRLHLNLSSVYKHLLPTNLIHIPSSGFSQLRNPRWRRLAVAWKREEGQN